MAVKALVPFLVAMMLVTGVCNTLLTKYQDQQCVAHCDGPRKARRYFEQPVIQTLQMFIGEMGSWLVVGGFAIYQHFVLRSAGYEAIPDSAPVADEAANSTAENDDPSPTPPVANPLRPVHDPHERIPLHGWKVLLLALPACCDIAGTTLMNVGLLFVAASIYQMTRGALVLFVGLFSVLFLKRRLSPYKWFALFVVVAGVAIVGLAGAIAKEGGDGEVGPNTAGALKMLLTRALTTEAEITDDDGAAIAVRTVIGVFLIAGAQIFTASQFVLEESIMEKYAMEPLKVVGWEGIFGFLVTALVMVIGHFAVGRTPAGRHGYFDAVEGLSIMFNHRAIALSSFLIMISIGGFNFFGLSVTRTVSATSRSTIDTCRTLFIWIVSLGLGWETFKWLQVVGFALLVYGTFLFNELVRPPFKGVLGRYTRRRQELLPEGPIEHN